MSFITNDIQINGVKACVIVTGEYTGDGSTGFAVTGLGFQPKWVQIQEREITDSTNVNIYTTSDTVIDDNVAGMAIFNDKLNVESKTNKIVSLDVDGFTVSDNAANEHPNKTGNKYNFIALG